MRQMRGQMHLAQCRFFGEGQTRASRIAPSALEFVHSHMCVCVCGCLDAEMQPLGRLISWRGQIEMGWGVREIHIKWPSKDLRGRGTIFFDVRDYIDKKRPNVFVLENVRG